MAESSPPDNVVIEINGESSSHHNASEEQIEPKSADVIQNGPSVNLGKQDTLTLPSPIIRTASKKSLGSNSNSSQNDPQLSEEV